MGRSDSSFTPQNGRPTNKAFSTLPLLRTVPSRSLLKTLDRFVDSESIPSITLLCKAERGDQRWPGYQTQQRAVHDSPSKYEPKRLLMTTMFQTTYAAFDAMLGSRPGLIWFKEHCSRLSVVQSEPGLPYAKRRKHVVHGSWGWQHPAPSPPVI